MNEGLEPRAVAVDSDAHSLWEHDGLWREMGRACAGFLARRGDVSDGELRYRTALAHRSRAAGRTKKEGA